MIPIFVIVLSAFLCTTSVITDLSPKYVVALGSILIAIAVYYFIVYKRNHLKYMGMYCFVVCTICFLFILCRCNNFPHSNPFGGSSGRFKAIVTKLRFIVLKWQIYFM